MKCSKLEFAVLRDKRSRGKRQVDENRFYLTAAFDLTLLTVV